jgi:hypothetical protein
MWNPTWVSSLCINPRTCRDVGTLTDFEVGNLEKQTPKTSSVEPFTPTHHSGTQEFLNPQNEVEIINPQTFNSNVSNPQPESPVYSENEENLQPSPKTGQEVQIFNLAKVSYICVPCKSKPKHKNSFCYLKQCLKRHLVQTTKCQGKFVSLYINNKQSSETIDIHSEGFWNKLLKIYDENIHQFDEFQKSLIFTVKKTSDEV